MKFNQLKAGVALSYVSIGVKYIIAIIFTPIMLRLLGQHEYGLYALVASVVTYLGLLNFGFGSAYIRFYSKYKVKDDYEKIARLNGMFFIIFIVIGFIAILAGVVLVLNSQWIFGSQLTSQELSRAKILMTIMVGNIAFSFPNIIFNSHIIANEQFIFQKSLEIAKNLLNPFMVLPLLLLGYGSIGMAVAITFLNVGIEVTNAIFCFRKLQIRFSFEEFDFSLMKEMALFSSFIFINIIVDQVNWNIDKFILGRFHGTIAVAVYGLAAQLNTYYMAFSSAISNVFIPRVHKIVATANDNEALTVLFTRVGRIQFVILSLISSGLVFFGRPFLNMWVGINYEGSYPILLLLIIPVTIPLIQNIGIEIQRAKNMHQFRSYVYLIIAVLNVLITIPLARTYGGVGAAIGTASALILGNGFVINWYYHARIGLNMGFFWSQIFKFIPALTIPIIVGVLFNMNIDLFNIQRFFIAGLVYVLAFCISMWFLGLNGYEKSLVKKSVVCLLKSVKLAR